MNKIIYFMLLFATSNILNAKILKCSDGWFELTAKVVSNEVLKDVELSNKYGLIAGHDYIVDSNKHNNDEPPYWFVLPTNKACNGKRTLVLSTNLKEVEEDLQFRANFLCGGYLDKGKMACYID